MNSSTALSEEKTNILGAKPLTRIRGFSLRPLLIPLSLLLTLFPVVRMLHILSTNGGNNLSVDDVVIAPLIDQILNGSYQWKYLFRDTFINGHAQLLPILTQVLFAYISSWNAYTVLYFGIGLSFLKLLLLYGLFTRNCKYLLKWLLLPILSFLVFSPSQLTVFEFEFPSMQLGINHLMFVLGLWGLVRFPNRWAGVGLMVFGGAGASFSWASGMLVWPIFLLTMILLKFRRIGFYLTLVFAGTLSAFPYFYFLVFHPKTDLYSLLELRTQAGNFTFVSWLNLPFILQAFGWPFSQNFSLKTAGIRGAIGIVLFIVSVGILWFQRKKIDWKASTPPLMVLAFSILNIWQISLFRFLMAQWYASPFMLFWIGLVGLAYVWSADRKAFADSAGVGYSSLSFTRHFWCEAVLLIGLYFYLTSNITFQDKSYYLQTRSPASASCLRHYSTAPTYCERTLFLWHPGQYQILSQLAQPLQRNGLSVFASRQRWTLQGDFILDNVKLHETPNIPDIHWSADLSAEWVPFSDYRQLNLFLHTPNAVDWTVQLPKNLKNAEFHSAIAISKSAPHDPQSDGVIFEVSAQSAEGAKEVLFRRLVSADQLEWIPFKISLTKYAGQSLTLRLTSDMNEGIGHDWAMYRHPYIDLSLEEGKSMPPPDTVSVIPSNTDLGSTLVKPTPKDFVFDLNMESLWEKGETDLTNRNDSYLLPGWLMSRLQLLEYKKSLNVCLADYSHLYFKVAAPSEIYPRATQVFLKLEGSRDIDRVLVIPLLSDEETHAYTYDLKLLELDPQARLKGLKIKPLYRLPSLKSNPVQLTDLRLVGGEEKTKCQKTIF